MRPTVALPREGRNIGHPSCVFLWLGIRMRQAVAFFERGGTISHVNGLIVAGSMYQTSPL